MRPDYELLPVSDAHYEQARQYAEACDTHLLDVAAREAGLPSWVWRNDSTLDALGRNATSALRMPLPSPYTQALREELGLPGGIITSEGSKWSLTIGGLDPRQPHDIGVRLVCIKKAAALAIREVRLPLDLAIPDWQYRQIKDRPDRIEVQVGERQLPSTRHVYHEEAQRLLLIAQRFVELLANNAVVVEDASTEQLPQRGWWTALLGGPEPRS